MEARCDMVQFNLTLMLCYYAILFVLCFIPLFVYLFFSLIERRKERKRGKRLKFYYPFLDWCKYTRMEISKNRLMLNEEVENALLYSCPIQYRLVHPFEDESPHGCTIELRLIDWGYNAYPPSFYSLYIYIFIYYIL